MKNILTFYVNSQNNKNLDMLIYQFKFIDSIHIDQNSVQLMKHLKSRVLKHAMQSLTTGLKIGWPSDRIGSSFYLPIRQKIKMNPIRSDEKTEN